MSEVINNVSVATEENADLNTAVLQQLVAKGMQPEAAQELAAIRNAELRALAIEVFQKTGAEVGRIIEATTALGDNLLSFARGRYKEILLAIIAGLIGFVTPAFGDQVAKELRVAADKARADASNKREEADAMERRRKEAENKLAELEDREQEIKRKAAERIARLIELGIIPED
jgi:hypothetical protein